MKKLKINWVKICESDQLQSIPENTSAVHLTIAGDDTVISSLFTKCKDIQHFYVDPANYITEADICFLSENSQLLSLKLINIPVTNEGLKHLSTISTLEELELELVSDKIYAKGYAALAKLTNLKKLIIRYTKLPDFALNHIGKMGQLKHLEIETNKELYNGIIRIANIESLEYLSLNCHKLSKYTYSLLDKAQKLKKLNVGKNCGMTYDECYFHQKNLNVKVFYDNKPLNDQLMSEEELNVFWEDLLKTKAEKRDSFISGLPPIDCWADDLTKFLNMRFMTLDKKRLEIEAKHALEFIKSESLPCYSKEPEDIQTDMLVDLLISIKDQAQRKEIYSDITGQMSKYLWGHNYLWFNSILAHEKDKQVYWEVLMSYDKDMGVFPLINMHIIDIVRGKVKSEWDPAEMNKLKTIAGKLEEQSECPVCSKQLTIWEMGDDRCKACREKSFDDWNERFEDLERMDEED